MSGSQEHPHRGLGIGWWSVVFDLVLPVPKCAAEYRRYSLMATEFAESVQCLGRNLAVAGALSRAYALGRERTEWADRVRYDEIAPYPQAWTPNLDGKESP